MTRGAARAVGASNSLRTLRDPGHQVEAGERHRQDAVDALVGSASTGFWGTVRTMTGTPRLGVVDLLDELQALDPALEQRVDDDDVGPELADLGDGLAAVGDDVEQLDLSLGVQQAADVLRDLRHVLDDQQANLVARWHRPTIPRGRGSGPARTSPPTGQRAGPDGLTA